MQTSGRFNQSSALIVATRQPASCNCCAIFSVMKPLPLASMPLMPTTMARCGDVARRIATILVRNSSTERDCRSDIIAGLSDDLAGKMPPAPQPKWLCYHSSGHRHHFWLLAPGVHSLEQVIADAQRVRDDGQSRIDRAAGREKARIDDVEII